VRKKKHSNGGEQGLEKKKKIFTSIRKEPKIVFTAKAATEVTLTTLHSKRKNRSKRLRKGIRRASRKKNGRLSGLRPGGRKMGLGRHNGRTGGSAARGSGSRKK